MKVKSAIPDSRIATKAKPQSKKPSNLKPEGRQFAAPLCLSATIAAGRTRAGFSLQPVPAVSVLRSQQHGWSQVLPVLSHNLSKNANPLECGYNLNLRIVLVVRNKFIVGG